MKTIFLDINDKIYINKNLTYNITTKSYRVDMKKLGTWERATFSCAPEFSNFAIIESLFKNSPATKFVSMYQTIWINDISLNESNRINIKSTWWQQNASESWHSLWVDTLLPSRRTIHNYNLLDTGRKSFTSQIAGYWESTRDKSYSHNNPNRRARQPLCDSKNLQNAG